MYKRSVSLLLFLLIISSGGPLSKAQTVIDLTLDSAVDLATENSYRMEQLKLGIQESTKWLEAEQAGLKSEVSMNITAPEIEAVSNNKWNSSLSRYELVRENSRMWRANLSIEQPVVLLGYPTNGYLSVNNRVYRYAQGSADSPNIRYYNRYFIKFEQPFFQPNELKNSIREAELDLENERLDFKENVVGLIDDIADDYYELFELSYEREIYQNRVDNLKKAKAVAAQVAREDTSRSIEVNQLQVELGNAREQLSQARSDFRLRASQVKQRLRLHPGDSLHVAPVATITPLQIDEQKALEYGKTLRPRLRELGIRQEQRKLDLKETKGWNSFSVNLEATYGREMQNPRLDELFGRPTNSYTVGLSAHIPIWDWGQHDAQIQARQISLKRTRLRIEEAQENIRSSITNAIQNLEEYQRRAAGLRENLDIARQVADRNLRRYRRGEISVLSLIQSINGQRETALNFLEAYLGYREALLSLQENTYYDFEKGVPLLERFQFERFLN